MLEVLDMVGQAAGRPIPRVFGPRRPGDLDRIATAFGAPGLFTCGDDSLSDEIAVSFAATLATRRAGKLFRMR